MLCCYSLHAQQLTSGLQEYALGNRVYAVTTPTNYDPNKEYPIVFELHGLGSNRTQMHDQQIVDTEQYISVRPEGIYVSLLDYQGNVWNTWGYLTGLFTGSNDVAHITNVYNNLKEKMGATFNPEKVYVYGFSNGGAMAMKMIEETSLFKAAIIRSMSFVKNHTIPANASKIPIIFVHGTADNWVPYGGGVATANPLLPLVSPTFESIKTTVAKWAAHYQLTGTHQEIKYLEGGGANSLHDFYYREYAHHQYPIYFFVIQNGIHTTTDQFDNYNIKRAVLKLGKNPKCYGLARGLQDCN